MALSMRNVVLGCSAVTVAFTALQRELLTLLSQDAVNEYPSKRSAGSRPVVLLFQAKPLTSLARLGHREQPRQPVSGSVQALLSLPVQGAQSAAEQARVVALRTTSLLSLLPPPECHIPQTLLLDFWSYSSEAKPKERFYSTDAVPHRDHREQELPSRQYDKAALSAENYRKELAQLSRRLEEMRVRLPKQRFGDTNAELMRFAFTMGLCDAQSQHQRDVAVERSAERIAEAMDWVEKHEFLSKELLERWRPLLHWADSQTAHHPLLTIRLGQATRDCHGHELDEFANAIISQVQIAVETTFSDAPGKPEQMMVVADCSHASTLQASHVLKLIKHVSLTLNRYYPGRLHCFYLVNLPRMLRWPVKAIIALGHPTTRGKVILCEADDERLPAEFRCS